MITRLNLWQREGNDDFLFCKVKREEPTVHWAADCCVSQDHKGDRHEVRKTVLKAEWQDRKSSGPGCHQWAAESSFTWTPLQLYEPVHCLSVSARLSQAVLLSVADSIPAALHLTSKSRRNSPFCEIPLKPTDWASGYFLRMLVKERMIMT